MTISFVAIDFETANYSRGSACSVGLTRVEGGNIVEKIHRLINPQDYFLGGCEINCVNGHGYVNLILKRDLLWPKRQRNKSSRTG